MKCPECGGRKLIFVRRAGGKDWHGERDDDMMRYEQYECGNCGERWWFDIIDGTIS